MPVQRINFKSLEFRFSGFGSGLGFRIQGLTVYCFTYTSSLIKKMLVV
jgi:hypothetical protein